MILREVFLSEVFQKQTGTSHPCLFPVTRSEAGVLQLSVLSTS
ncbi:hypothetical protein RBSH_02519 [Rhodopirellula baltica SH28]|uniref:Uncharacterized protein n=2 Tax=Rhodopirellula baltica TaxID=265606 RepID=F2AP65_RHOBT|nr:hypothetical protein RBWH47_04191 [Rhodopirellula baltica WH47]EKK02188.1 hypothetical protein RBSH_02519 [Rhodopirellula baltica SH28]